MYSKIRSNKTKIYSNNMLALKFLPTGRTFSTTVTNCRQARFAVENMTTVGFGRLVHSMIELFVTNLALFHTTDFSLELRTFAFEQG